MFATLFTYLAHYCLTFVESSEFEVLPTFAIYFVLFSVNEVGVQTENSPAVGGVALGTCETFNNRENSI